MKEHQLFDQSIDTLTTLSDDFSKQMQPYVIQFYELMESILKQNIAKEETDNLLAEGNVEVDKELVVQQVRILTFINNYIEHDPEGLSGKFNEFFQMVTTKVAFAEEQKAALLYSMAQLIHVALFLKQDALAVHNAVFQHFMNMIYPGPNNVENTVIFTDLEQLTTAANGLQLYIQYYIRTAKQQKDPQLLATC